MCEELKAYCGTYGKQKELADACGVSPQAITKWLKQGVPPMRVLQVEEGTGCKVSRHKIRPDIYPVEESEENVA